jgi:hypothetical protein
MKSYVPPHKRAVKRNDFDFTTPWINNNQSKKPVNQNLKNANFPRFNEKSDKSNDNTSTTNEVYNYKKVTDLFKKKRELQEKNKNKLKPGWIKLSKDAKYEKTETELENYYKNQIRVERIKKFLNNQEKYYRAYEEMYNEDIRYYISESESEIENSDCESESLSENDYENEEYYEEQEKYLNKYNRN